MIERSKHWITDEKEDRSGDDSEREAREQKSVCPCSDISAFQSDQEDFSLS